MLTAIVKLNVISDIKKTRFGVRLTQLLDETEMVMSRPRLGQLSS